MSQCQCYCLTELLTVQPSTKIVSCGSVEVKDTILSLFITEERDLVLCRIEKQTKDIAKLDVPVNFTVNHLQWFKNELFKGCEICFSPYGDYALVISASFNIFRISMRSVYPDVVFPGETYFTRDSQGVSTQVFIPPRECMWGVPTSLVWWETTDLAQLAAVATKSGKIVIINISKGLLVGECSVDVCIVRLQLLLDNALDCLYLIIHTNGRGYYRLLVEQKSCGYTWPGASHSPSHQGGHELTSVLNLDTSSAASTTSSSPPDSASNSGEGRSRLAGLKQMSVEKIASIRHRLAEGRKLLRSKSECEDLAASPKPHKIGFQLGSCSHLSVGRELEQSEDQQQQQKSHRSFLSAFHPAKSQVTLFDPQLEPISGANFPINFIDPHQRVVQLVHTGHTALFCVADRSTRNTSDAGGEKGGGDRGDSVGEDRGRVQYKLLLSSFLRSPDTARSSSQQQLANAVLQLFTLEEDEEVLSLIKVDTDFTVLPSSPSSSQPSSNQLFRQLAAHLPRDGNGDVTRSSHRVSTPSTSPRRTRTRAGGVSVSPGRRNHQSTGYSPRRQSLDESSGKGAPDDVPPTQSRSAPDAEFRSQLEDRIRRLRLKCGESLTSFHIVTNQRVLYLEAVRNPVDVCLDLISQNHRLADILISSFSLNKSKLLELAGDLRLSCNDFPGAVSMYRQSGARPLTTALKLATYGSVSELLSFLQVVFANRSLEATHSEKIHLSNLALICFYQQILQASILARNGLENKFVDFLQNNRFYDSQLMVSKGVETQAWRVLARIIPHHGLHQELGEALARWLERVEETASTRDSLLASLATGEEEEGGGGGGRRPILPAILNNTLLVATGSCPTVSLRIVQLLELLLPTMQRSDMTTVLEMSNPYRQDILPLIYLPDDCPEPEGSSLLSQSLLHLFTLTLLHLIQSLTAGESKEGEAGGLDLLSSLLPATTNSSQLVQQDSETCNDKTKEARLQDGQESGLQVVQESILSSGYGHTLLVRRDRSLLSWGANSAGCTGIRPSNSSFHLPSPLNTFSSLGIRVAQVSCGKCHSLALTENGVYSWGSNKYGQLGIGQGVNRCSQPQLLRYWVSDQRDEVDEGGRRAIVQVVAGQYHNLALDSSGCVYSWGWGVHGQLGHNTVDDSPLPRLVQGLSGDPHRGGSDGGGRGGRAQLVVVQVAAGFAHSLALTASGRVYTFGLGMFGQLGTGHNTKTTRPVQVPIPCAKGVKGGGRVSLIASGYFHNLALTQEGRLYQWGAHPQILRLEAQQRKKEKLQHQQQQQQKQQQQQQQKQQQQLRILESDDATAKSLNGNSSPPAQGGKMTRSTSHQELNGQGQPGGGHNGHQPRAQQQLSGGPAADMFPVFRAHQSDPPPSFEEAVVAQSTAANSGRTGGADSLPVYVEPVSEQHLSPQVVSLEQVQGRISRLSCGSQHSLLLTKQGQLFTWGRSMDGQLGQGGRGSTRIPLPVVGLDKDYICYASCGSDFCTAISDSGSIYGWGSNTEGQLAKTPLEGSSVRGGQEQTKVLVMKTSKRIIRLQHGLHNSCDVPKPLTGLAKSGIYSEESPRLSIATPVTEFYARLAPPPSDFPAKFTGAALQACLHRTIERFYSLLPHSALLRNAQVLGNHVAAAKLCFLQEKYLQAFDLTLQAVIKEEVGKIPETIFRAFIFYFQNSRVTSDNLYVQNQLFERMVNCWQHRKYSFSRLEELLMSHVEEEVEGEGARVLERLIYILFCPSQERVQATDGPDNRSLSDPQLVDLFSPEFCLRIGDMFVQRVRDTGAEDSMKSDMNRDNPDFAVHLKNLVTDLINKEPVAPTLDHHQKTENRQK